MLALSALGYPLTQLAIRLLGRRGAVVVEAACCGLLVRDVTMLACGVPRRLRRGPAALLWFEAAVAAAAALTGLGAVLEQDSRKRAARLEQSRFEVLRRGSVGLLFALHTLRFWIYLQPGKGRRGGVEPTAPAREA